MPLRQKNLSDHETAEAHSYITETTVKTQKSLSGWVMNTAKIAGPEPCGRNSRCPGEDRKASRQKMGSTKQDTVRDSYVFQTTGSISQI